jgi:hypothetical protein
MIFDISYFVGHVEEYLCFLNNVDTWKINFSNLIALIFVTVKCMWDLSDKSANTFCVICWKIRQS